MGGSRNDGFMQRKSVNTDIQEAADHDSKYEDYDVRNRIEEKKHREFLSGGVLVSKQINTTDVSVIQMYFILQLLFL